VSTLQKFKLVLQMSPEPSCGCGTPERGWCRRM